MKKVAALLLGVFLLLGCSNNPDTPPMPDPTTIEGTVFAYFIANNNLENSLRTNIVDMYRGLAAMSKPSEFLVYWDGVEGAAYWPNPSILRYRTDGAGRINGSAAVSSADEIVAMAEVLKEYPSQLASDKAVMAAVLKDMMEFSSYSTHHGFVIGSHGSGWLKHIDGSNSRALGPDGDYANSITIPDMVSAMEQVGKKFDFVLFDACAMGCAEVFYDLRSVANYAIASVIDVPDPGFPYSQMMKHLLGFSVTDYEKACQAYIDRYQAESNQGIKFGTMSLVDCSEMESLAAAIKEQVQAHATSIGTYDYVDFQFYGGGSMQRLSADMQQFIASLNKGVMPLSFEQQFKKTVLYTDYVTNTTYNKIDGANYCGMGMYLPLQNKRYWNEYFQTLAWYHAAGWEAVTWPLPQ